jgi:hypothetical protein
LAALKLFILFRARSWVVAWLPHGTCNRARLLSERNP